MRKRNTQPKLSRSTAHRNALLRNLSQELIRHGKIRTTIAKAKALRPFVEPLITRAKVNSPHSERLLTAVLYDREVVRMLMDTVGPRFAEENRPGGYVRIVKLGPRNGDGAEEVIVQLVESKKVESTEATPAKISKKGATDEKSN